MELRLRHGRDDPNQEMDSWGFDGPKLLQVDSLQQMYGETYTVRFVTDVAAHEAQRVTGWPIWDDRTLEAPNHDGLVKTHEPGKPARYYADLFLCCTEPHFEIVAASNQMMRASRALHEAMRSLNQDL